jgi:signal transduction histidine kinase
MAADRDGALWVIADNGSFWTLADTVYKIKNGKITTYSGRNGLPENIQQVYCDDEGLVWLANRKGVGLLADEYYEFNKITSGGYTTPVVSLTIGDKKKIWAGTITGLVQKRDARFRFYFSTDKEQIGYVAWLSKTKNGCFLAGTVAGVLKIDGNSIKKYLSIHSTAFGAGYNNCLWFGGVNGEVWRYNGKLPERLKMAFPVAEMITAVHADAENLWIGYRSKGIVKYKIKNDSLLSSKEYTVATGFKDMRIRCCASDKKGNTIWGTRTNGVFIFSMGNSRLVAHINTQNGLTANWVKDLFCDNDGTLYLATNQGINIVTGNYKNPTIKTVKIDDDNINRETNCIIKDDGVFYAGTNEGILKWMPGNIRRDTVSPPVYFTKINIPGIKNFSVYPYSASAQAVSLPYDKHFISFEFAGVSLKSPQNLLYHYILTGQDNEWSRLTEHNDVAFDLKPGNYTFKVAAKNADGVWSRRPAVFHFVINSPFWQTWWFIVLAAVIIMYAAYSAYRYKLSKMLALELLRNKISTDLHDDIGSTLSSISILSEVAAREKEQKSKRILAEIHERSHSLMEKMDDLVWSISTRNDTAGHLFVRIQQFASAVFEAKDINYEVRIAANIKEMKLDMQRRQHIYLILKEAVNNLIKYSECSTVCITAGHTGKLLKIEVFDNGKGFDTATIYNGNGLLNMQKRSAAIGGNLHIASSPGSGTRVSLAIEID